MKPVTVKKDILNYLYINDYFLEICIYILHSYKYKILAMY